MFIFAAAVILGCLYPCDAELPAVGNCTFMEYYCSIREYELNFFKPLKEGSSTDCGLQFWMLYYHSLKKSKECLETTPTLEVANIQEMELLYCRGKDLEIPLVSSLPLCSSLDKRKVDQCIHDFATTFSKDPTDKSLCKKRGHARICVIAAWEAVCNHTATSSAIFNNVIADFNPFCDEGRDPWATAKDPCNLTYYDKTTQAPSGTVQSKCSVTAVSRNLLLCVVAFLYFINGSN